MLIATPQHHDPAIKKLYNILLGFSLLNLFIVAISGLALRGYFFFPLPLEFKNLLHGHSHFAFGGWVMPVLFSLVLRYFPSLANRYSIKHWRRLSFMFLLSAYGMLVSFPAGGYSFISIVFSTVSLVAIFYLALLVWKAGIGKYAAEKFLIWGLIYGVLSSLGPFLTGPLIVMGYKGSPEYYNAIYFFLHFQYNGLFVFLALAVFFQIFMKKKRKGAAGIFFRLMNLAVVPSFALSLLWNKPHLVWNVIGFSGALIQLIAILFFIRILRENNIHSRFNPIWKFVFVAFCVKLFLQLISAFPLVASLAVSQRNFIIAYLHLVLLGIISFSVFAILQNVLKKEITGRWGVRIFFTGFIITELFLVAQATGSAFMWALPFFNELIFIFSCLLPVGSLLMFYSVSVRKIFSYRSSKTRLRPAFIE